MTYKGIYRDGIVILRGEVDLQNGDPVEVNSAPPAKRTGTKSGRTSAKSRKPVPTSKRSKSADKLPAFGIWKDRWPSSMTSAQIARELREQASRRTR